MSQPRLIRPFELVPDELDWTGRRLGETIWQMLNAARDGDTTRLRAMLEDDPTLVNAEFWYTPPLHFAVREGHLDATRMLLEAGADIFHCSLYAQETLLQMALDRGHDEVANLLRDELRRRVSSSGSRHAIHDAVSAGDADTVEKLLAGEPDLANRGDHLGRRPLHFAVEVGRADLVNRRIDLGADVDASGFSSDDRLGGTGFRPVALALWHHPYWHHPYWQQRNDYAIARQLLARGARYSITVAAALGDEERARELLASNAELANDQEPGGKRPLSAAAERNHVAIVKHLLDAGTDPNLGEGPNCPKGYALWAAARLGFFEVAKMLLDAGADPNADVESSGTPTGTSNKEMRALLYEHGGRMPLAMHFYEGNIDTVAALLDAKPDMFDELRVTEGFTMAVSAGHDALVGLMLARGLRVPASGYLLPDLPVGIARPRPFAARSRHGPQPAQLAAGPPASLHCRERGNRQGAFISQIRRRPQRHRRGIPHDAPRLGGSTRTDRIRPLRVGERFRSNAAGSASLGNPAGLGSMQGPRRSCQVAGKPCPELSISDPFGLPQCNPPATAARPRQPIKDPPLRTDTKADKS